MMRTRNTAVCSVIKSKTRKPRRSLSGSSIDVKGSVVMEKVWVFEDMKEKYGGSTDQLLEEDTGTDSWCRKHTWQLYTNLLTSQLCAKCDKRILPQRAAYKCTECRDLCHLKCVAESVSPSGTSEDRKMDRTEFVTTSRGRYKDKKLSETGRHRQPLSPIHQNLDQVDTMSGDMYYIDDDNNNKDELEAYQANNDPNVTKQSQTKKKLTSMKHGIVKRCKSIKKKVKTLKEKVEDKVGNGEKKEQPTQNCADELDAVISREECTLNTAQAAWENSPIRSGLRSYRAGLNDKDKSDWLDTSVQEEVNSRSQRLNGVRKRINSYKRSNSRRFQAYDFDVHDIKDRLTEVEKKLKQLEQSIPAELEKWCTMHMKYDADSPVRGGKLRASGQKSVGHEKASRNDTQLKNLEAQILPHSASSGTSDEVYMVPGSSSSSHDDGHMIHEDGHMIHKGSHVIHNMSEREDSNSMPSGIPNRLKLDIKKARCSPYSDLQTSTPVTNREISFRSASKQYNETHTIKHINITNISMESPTSQTIPISSSFTKTHSNHVEAKSEKLRSSNSAREFSRNHKVLSPEQQVVKTFLERRKSKSSPRNVNNSFEGSGGDSPVEAHHYSGQAYSSPPIASSTFRNGDSINHDELNSANLSPVSFTFRNDFVDNSQASFSKIADDDPEFHDARRSQLQAENMNVKNDSMGSNLSYTFRNDSQMVPTPAEEDLPGFTRNQPGHDRPRTQVVYDGTTTDSEERGYDGQDQRPTRDYDGQDQCPARQFEVMADIETDCPREYVAMTRQESSAMTTSDGLSLTNVTQFTGESHNSFDTEGYQHQSKLTNYNKDLDRLTKEPVRPPRRQKRSKSTSPKSKHLIDEKGDSKKPPKPFRRSSSATSCNFLVEAEKRLDAYQSRRSVESEVGVCLEKLPRPSALNALDTDSTDDLAEVKENMMQKSFVGEQLSMANLTSKFEEIERKFKEESITEKIIYSRSLSRLPKLDGDVNRQACLDRSISCTSSLDGETRAMLNENAKYHFLHEKGMIKISSPSLKLMSGSPSARRREQHYENIEEEMSTDLAESGSESEVSGMFVVDNQFQINRNGNARREMGTTSSERDTKPTPSVTETQETETRETMSVRSEGEVCREKLQMAMFEEVLQTVDTNQEAWDNVLNWMNKDHSDEHDDQQDRAAMEEELRTLMREEAETEGDRPHPSSPGLAGRRSYREKKHSRQHSQVESELEALINRHEEGAVLNEGHSQSPEDESVYYSFQGQSAELRSLLSPRQHPVMNNESPRQQIATYSDITPQQQNALLSEGNPNQLNMRAFHPERFQNLQQDYGLEFGPGLMWTILNGSVQDVEDFLNSDRTISELDIKEAVNWALENKNFEITLLLLEDICRLIRASEDVNCVEVFPAYTEKYRWKPIFVILSKQNFQGEWDQFMGFPVYRRRYDFVSAEAALVINNDLVRNNPLSLDDFTTIRTAISSSDLHVKHSKITVVNACPYRSKREGEILEKQMCVVIHCLLKGFIPFDEEPFPRELDGIPVDVREGYFRLGVGTPPKSHNSQQPWDDGASTSDEAGSQYSSALLSGSQSDVSGRRLSTASCSGVQSLVDEANSGSQASLNGSGLGYDIEGDALMLGPAGDGTMTSEAIISQMHKMDLDQLPGLNYGPKSKDVHHNLLMGACIGPSGGERSGTLGGFVSLPGGLGYITCSHVLGPVERDNKGTKMSQPADAELVTNDVKTRKQTVCGDVLRHVFMPGSCDDAGVDAALVKVTCRQPDDGRFIWVRKEQLTFAGFDPCDPPTFSKGKVLKSSDITPRKRNLNVLKFGGETGLTRGLLYLNGASFQCPNREMTLPSNNKVEFFNQMEILSIQGTTRFFDLGDSGSLVFMPLENELHCIGLAVGCTSYGSCVVTPIENVFEKLKLPAKFYDFTKNQTKF